MWNKRNIILMFCSLMFGVSFYGVMVTLTPFFLDGLKYDESKTMMIMGAFSGLGALFGIIGGFMGDKFLGAFRSFNLGFVGLSAGYFLIMLGAMMTSAQMAIFGIAVLSYARGLLGPNFIPVFKATFTGQEELEKAMPINYSVNNIGAFLGQWIFPFLMVIVGFHGNFMLSGIFGVLGIFALLYIRKQILPIVLENDRNPVSQTNWIYFTIVSLLMLGLVYFMFSDLEKGKWVVYAIGGAAILYFFYLMFTSVYSTMMRMGSIIIIVLLATGFYVYYTQMMTSMNIIAINTMRGDLFGFFPIEPAGSMVMNPLWCIVAGPVLALIFLKLEARNIFLSTATKFGYAFILTVFAFAILTFALKSIGTDVTLRPEVFLVVHFFQAFAEVIIGSLTAAFIISVAPKSLSSFCVSLAGVAIALSSLIGAEVSKAVALDKGVELTQEIAINVYGNFFQMLTIWAIGFAVVTFIFAFFINMMIKSAKKWDEANKGVADPYG